MKDEIKEFNEEKYVEMLEDGTLYDYITNLQEENEKQRDYICDLVSDKVKYKSRNEKAIEYINKYKNQNWYIESRFTGELLNLLQGVDKE